MAGTLTVEIVTPEAALWSGAATSLMARSSEGEFTILAQHTPMVGDVVPGVVRVESPEGNLSFVVHGGFFQVGASGEGDTLATVLAGVAEPADIIDVARATAAKEGAEALLARRSDDEDAVDLESARASLARAELRLSVATSSPR